MKINFYIVFFFYYFFNNKKKIDLKKKNINYFYILSTFFNAQ